MNRLFETVRELGASVPFRIGFAMLVALTAFVASDVRSLPNPLPLVALSPDPLYSKGLRSKPTMTLALSVEFPTVGAQYVNGSNPTEDNTYTPATQYIGYFDSESCYVYNNNTIDALRRFDRSGDATNHTCGGTGFSGNFMNWATSSAIDVLRYALTGGDRVVDTSNLTVLQRAILPNTSVSSQFWNGSNFPSKRLRATYVAGAVPTGISSGAGSNDIFIANCYNRVHFGTQATGSCASPGNNSNLGSSSQPVLIGPISIIAPFSVDLSVLTNPWVLCASEGQTCAFAGIRQVAYGAGFIAGSWAVASAKDGVQCGNTANGGAFPDPFYGQSKKCYIRSDPTGWQPTTLNPTALSADRYFYSRVSVCGVDSSGNLLDPRTNFCLKYPAGNYKPIGNLQRYSDSIRVAAFSYLNDSTPDPSQRYGGVLRAAMKYAGAKTFDANFVQSPNANAQQEWDAQTGVFLQNPDAGTTGLIAVNSGPDSNWPNAPISGVTNYLNQFGRTGPILGQYKTYDPVGELYYEALRYIQGLPVTPAAVSGLGVADPNRLTYMDGYPAYTAWTDPHPPVAGLGANGYTCVKNNILVIGDVNTWNDKSYPGNPSGRATNGDWARPVNVAGNEPDFYNWTKVVGSFEANSGMAYVDGQGVARTATNAGTTNSGLAGIADRDIGAEGAAYYIAGAAYWANTHDIRGTDWTAAPALQRPGMRASTFMLDVNEHANDSDYGTRASTQFFLAGKYGGFSDVTLTGNPFVGYGTGNTVVNSDANWSKPSLTGNAAQLEAKNYYLSSSASSVVSALNDIFNNIAKGANSIAGAAISTQSLTASNGFIYQARFDPTNYWSGDVIPFQITLNGTNVTIASEALAPWKAATVLDARNLATAPRNIFIGSQSLTPSTTAKPFIYSSMESSTQSLMKLPGDSDAVAALRVNYLRGDRTGEGTTFRQRGSRLGDIVNSGIAFSGPPAAALSDAGYAQFASDNATRPSLLFVGANDGMLHAFRADTGAEAYAYVPSWVAGRLPQLTTAAYVHQSYVDATPAVGQADLGTSGTAAWRTVLVGGTGGGGQGVYALDVTDPSVSTDSGASKLLWEFTDKHDPSLGNVIGKPQILKLRTITGGTTYKWYAVFASGVNNYAADGNASTTGFPAIFILDLSKKPGVAWTSGGSSPNYKKIELPRAAAGLAQGNSGFSVLTGNAGEVTYLYAGDLQGNLWKLDFTATGFNSISSATADTSSAPAADALSYYKNNGRAIPMYTAMDASSPTPKPQPITMDPALVYGRNKSIIVAFGTGKYLETADIAGGYTTQSLYALYDNQIVTTALDVPVSDAIAGRGRLSSITYSGGNLTGNTFIWGRPTSDTDLTRRAGWYLDLPASSSGERQVSDFNVLAGKLVAGSVIPAATSCDDGSGNSYVIDVFAGGGSYLQSNVGLLGQPLLFNVATGYDADKDSARTQNGYGVTQIVLTGSGGTAATTTAVTAVRAGRLSWRQLNNTN